MIYTVTLNPALDREIFIDDLSFNDVNRVKDQNIRAGGKGVNVSRILNKMGIENKAFVLIGGQRGKKYEELLKDENIDYVPFYIDGEIRENISLLVGKEKKEIRINESGPFISEQEIEKIKDIIGNFDENSTVFFSGSAAKGFENSIYFELIERLNKKKIKNILDADTEKLRLGLDAKPFLIKPNKEEFERLGKKVYNTQLGLIEDLKKINVDIKILTDGDKSLYLCAENKQYEIEPIKSDLKRTLGAGDCFLAVFYAYYEKGHSPVEAVRYAVSASYLYLEGRLNFENLDMLYERVIVKELEVGK